MTTDTITIDKDEFLKLQMVQNFFEGILCAGLSIKQTEAMGEYFKNLCEQEYSITFPEDVRPVEYMKKYEEFLKKEIMDS